MLLLPAGAVAAEPGVVPDLTWGTSAGDKDKTTQRMKQMGARWVRLNIGWQDAEPFRGSYNSHWFSQYDDAVERSHRAGARILMMVDTPPLWASGSATAQAPPRDASDYARFMRVLAARYAGKVDAYEVWNEPNHKFFWPPTPNPAAYAALLKAAYPAVKAADPHAKVVFGGLSGNDYSFLEQAFAAEPDLGAYFNVLGTHPYTETNPEAVWSDDDGRVSKHAFPSYRELRATLLARGLDKPIWITEFGWSTWSGGVTKAKQANYLKRAFKYLEQDPYVQVAIWYQLRNLYWFADADNWSAQLGLLRSNFRTKPAYSAFRRYARSRSRP